MSTYSDSAGSGANARSAFGHTQENEQFRDFIIGGHRDFAGVLRGAYEQERRRRGATSANILLRKVHDELQAPGMAFPVTMDVEEIATLALAKAKACNATKNESKPWEEKIALLMRFVEEHGFEWPIKVTAKDSADAIFKKHCAAAERVASEKWWRRRMRVAYGRSAETVARQFGAVKAGKSPYVSDWAFSRWKTQQAQNRIAIESKELEEAQTGELISMASAVDSSISNPSHMRDELMVRMRGWEEIAEAMDLRGLFLTLTCPSKYHARYESGPMNPKFDGSTPRDASAYLADVWARIRSAWGRVGIKAFGFRVCEPHHDGTPHWHMLLFFSPTQAKRAAEIFGKYALLEDGHEQGAEKYRWDCVEIDPAKGTAAGYIAKYISKNLDGYQVDYDDEGGVYATEGAARVKAWASLWGIRQFQQIGCASVTVWRELRRRREPLEDWEPEEAEAIRQAADAGNWAEFVELMGGAFSGRDDQKLRALHVVRPEPNGYGEEVSKVIGLVMRGAKRMIQTRFKVWNVQEVGTARRRSDERQEAMYQQLTEGRAPSEVREFFSKSAR